ncbi:phosphatase PAP2 family protein [Nocardioides pelophilus]|uniref:phosphatase PAP2 family protein n=1 Tax=Nocardioides pelophilus TaxID=2172019 RepID=UPI00160125C3|nr:phosphatase PAP2 family protein [Nocardioides pelophilus]
MAESRNAALATQRRAYAGVLLELGFIAAAVACYLAVRAYTADRTDAAVSNARGLLALERQLGVDWEHPIQDATLTVPGLSGFFTQFYIWGYFPTLVVVTIWLYLRSREAYRALRTGLLVSGIVGLAAYASYPVAPPWIADASFTDTVSEGLFLSVARPSGVTNHLGAFPSFHVGWVILVGVVVFRTTRSYVVRTLCVLHPAAMSYAVVSTANHWVLDIPAGVALAAVGLLAGTYLSGTGPGARPGRGHRSVALAGRRMVIPGGTGRSTYP